MESVCEESEEAERYTPFNPHREFAFQIKASLNAGNRKDVDVRIDMPFDSTPLPRSSRRCRVATRGGRRSAQSRLRNAAVVVVLRSTG